MDRWLAAWNRVNTARGRPELPRAVVHRFPELDADLATLGVSPARSLGTAFRGTLTAAEELVGRFFFVQRTQALQDGKALITYEFLHATFGEYLVARLVVRELSDAARDRFWARALGIGRPTDDLLRSLLSSLPMSTRTTVLPFAATLLRGVDRSSVRDWLVARLRLLFATLRWNDLAERGPDYATAIYALNLLLLTLCLGPVRACELMPEDDDPASTLRHAAQLWRAAVPAEHWFAVAETLDVRRIWSGGRRDIELSSAAPTSPIEQVEPFWSHRIAPGAEERSWETPSVISNFFELTSIQRSMHLSGNLGDDAFRHALQPLIDSLPHTISAFVIQRSGELESIAHSLIQLPCMPTAGSKRTIDPW